MKHRTVKRRTVNCSGWDCVIAAMPLMVVMLLCSRGVGLALDHGPAPRSAENLVSLGDALFHENRYKDAAKVFQYAATKFPDKPIPHLAYGHALFALGEFTASSKSLQAGITIFPDWAQARVDLRGFYNRKSVFFRRLRELQALADKGFDERFLLGYIFHFSGKKEAGARIFQLLDVDFPGNPLLQFFLPAKTMVWILNAPEEISTVMKIRSRGALQAELHRSIPSPRRRAFHQPLRMEGHA